jgi:hypothetical protein
MLGDHERRVRGVERARPGRWIWVGTYPTDPLTTSDSPPYENGWTGELRFRWDKDGRTELLGGVTDGPDDSVITTLPLGYRPGIIVPLQLPLLGGGGWADAEVRTNGEVFYYSALAPDADLTVHVGDTSGAHTASAISFTPAGTIAATNVQAAIEEVAAEAGGSGVPDLQFESRSTNTILGVADQGKAIDITATITQTFEADETLGDGWWVILRNATDTGTVVVTLNPAGTETIDGLTTVTMYAGEVRLVYCNGAGGNFNSLLLQGGFARFTADDNFIVPHGITKVIVECIGAGGGGGGGRGGAASSARNGGSGGGGGARIVEEFAAAALGNPGDTIAVDVGAGGTSGGGGSSGNGSNGGTGSSTTFGSLLTAHGGGPGLGGANTGNNRSGGGGGGAGEAGQVGADNTSSRGGANDTAGRSGQGAAGGGDNISGTGGGADYGGASGGHTFGGGGGNATTGGSSFRGPGGGGAGGDVSSGNVERTGGAGGSTGAYALAGTPGGGGAVNGGAGNPGSAGGVNACGGGGQGGGSQDSGTGGGGAGTTTGGAGGVGGIGECRVWYS